MDLQKLINEQVSQYVKDSLPETIKKHLDGMMDSVLGDIFSRYGENSKAIKNAISEKINIDLSRLDLMDYNWMIANAVEKHFAQLVQERSCKPVLEILQTIIGDPYKKEAITLNELVDEIVEIFDDWAEYWDDVEVPFYAEYNKKHKWIECWTDDESGTEKRDCKIRFIFWESWSIFSLHFLNYSWEKKSPMDLTCLDAVEKLIHKLYTSGVKITHDETEDWEIEFDQLSFTKED